MRTRTFLYIALPALIVVALVFNPASAVAQQTTTGIDCSQIAAKHLLQQDNMRAGLTLMECGVIPRPHGESSRRNRWKPFDREFEEAIGSLVAIAIERAGTVEKLAHSEAGRESKDGCAAVLLLDSVTHDFRTPLTAIKASAQSMLSDAELDETSRKELLTVINEESDRFDRW